MENPIQSIPSLPPAVGLAGPEQFWIVQAGVDKRTTLAAALGVGAGTGGGGAPTFTDYASLRGASYPPGVTAIVLNDPWKGGLFVRGPANTDNGGTRIHDASGQTWYRVYDERINAAWFYDAPPAADGTPTTLGSGPVKITAADIAANPQWIGLADDGGVGVQTAMPYPVGTYWDFVCLQEWIYACAADRSVPQTTFIGSMAGGQLTVTQWLGGAGYLSLGQSITGPGVQPCIVVALTNDPNVYWTGAPVNTAGISMTTASGNTFYGWVEGELLTIPAYGDPSQPVTVGDQIIDPLWPPNPHYLGVLPGTTIGPQVDGTPGGVGDYIAAIAQTVASEQMTGVGGPQWNTVGGFRNLNRPGFCPSGSMYLNQMLVINGNGLDLLFASKLGTALYWYGTATGTSKVGPAIKFNGLAYSTVKSLTVMDQTGVSNYLVSLSHTPTGAPGLYNENNTLHDWVLGGNYSTSACAVAVAPEGGYAQGDTQLFYACWATGFNDGFTFGGDNAIAGTFFGGQTQACPHYGVAAYGGSWSAYTMLTENNAAAYNYYACPQRTQVHLGGCDFFASQVATESCVCIGCRSEGTVGVYDLSGESLVTNWTCGGYFMAWAPNAHWTPGSLLQVNNPVGNYALVMIANDGGPGWMQSDPVSTTTVLTFNPSPGWTVNQWANYGIWLLAGRSASSNVVASNTANTITLVNPVAASGAHWWKLFAGSGAVAPNWGAVTHFGQFARNAVGWGFTACAGFNVFSSAQALNAGDWVMIPGAGVFPDGSGVTESLWGQAENKHPAATGWYMQANGNVANVWGTPSNPILLGASPSATSYNFFTSQSTGTPGQAGTYGLLYPQTLGANFTGFVSGNQLTVTAMAPNSGGIYAGQALGGAGIGSAPAPLITNAGAAITGFIDDGTGGTTPGTVLTVQSIANGSVILGAPLTSANTTISAGTIVLSQISGTPGGVGTYNIYPAQLVPQCTFTASIAGTAVMNVSAIASGSLAPGQSIAGAGVPATMRINSQVSGATGGIGNYNTNQGINIPSEPMTAAWGMSVGGQGARFTGHIDDGAGAQGHILTVTAIASGALDVGQTVNVPLTGPPAGITQQLTINALGTGAGGLGTYVLSGGALIVPSSSMTANTVAGVGVYGLSSPPGTIASEPMFSGYPSQTQPLWELQDGFGGAVNSAVSGFDQFGYWSAGIGPDSGGMTYMVIDYDVMYGCGSMDQCQLGGVGKVQAIGRLDNPGIDLGFTGQMIRPGEGYRGQFSYKNAVTYTAPPRSSVSASTSPFLIPASYFGQANVGVYVAPNITLGLTKLGPGMIVDIDVWLVAAVNGAVVTWDTNTVHAAAPTLTLGTTAQLTMCRMKWIGSGSTTGSPGNWYVMGVQGPM